MARLEVSTLEGIPEVKPGDSLAAIIVQAMAASGLAFADGDVVALAQKIVSKAENRFVRLADVTPSARALDYAQQTGKDARLIEVMLQESREVLRVRPGLIVVEDRRGLVLANAGIDASNVPGSVISRFTCTRFLVPIDCA
jgi:coenzyme F420-0:L-glutamate ligase/coenzyme F420-1:gamma-L-glutamate ligase